MGKFEGKVAFITGAARGQGRAEAVRLAEEGADIIAVDICSPIATAINAPSSEADLAETVRLVEATGRRIVASKADVRDLDGLRESLDEGIAQLGQLDITIANAGICSFGAAEETEEQAWDELVDTNLKGVWHTAKVAIPHLRRHGRGGSMVLTSSVLGLHAFGGLSAYVSAKHGVVGLMRGLAVELGPDRIRVNSIHPTQVNTAMLMNQAVYDRFSPELESATQETMAAVSQATHVLPIPWVEPIDIANAVAFLCSEEARYITGVALPIDAGADVIG